MVIFRQQKNFGPNVIYFVLRVDSWVSLPPGAKIREKQHLRIQEGHCLKSALNLDLTLSDDGKCPALLKSSGIIDLGAFCVELWSFFRQQKNFGPNVRYCVLEYHFGLSSWSSIDHVTSHSRVVALLNLPFSIYKLYKSRSLV